MFDGARACWRVAVYVAAALGVFVLPFYIPFSADVYSVSRTYHFNNRVAVVAALLGVALAAILHWCDQRRHDQPLPDHAPSDPLPDHAPHALTPRTPGEVAEASDSSDERLRIWPLLTMLAVAAVKMIVLWMASRWIPIGEAGYFVNRILCLQQGMIPYRDFEFAYGPAMIYVPLWLQRITGLSTLTAYLVAVACCYWLGIILLWWIVRQAQGTRNTKTIAFLLLAVFPAIIPEIGLQYTPTRFICGFAALAVAWSAVARLRGRWLLLALVDIALTVAVLAISPEIGLAFIAGLAACSALQWIAGARWIAWSAAAYLAMLAALLFLVPRETFMAVRDSATGGHAFPLFPSPYMLFYVATLLIAIPRLLAGSVQSTLGAARFATPFGPELTAAFVVQSVAMMPGAFGRADGGHVFWYGIGVFLLALLTIRHPAYPAGFLLAYPVLLLTLWTMVLGGELRFMVALGAAQWAVAHPRSLPSEGIQWMAGGEEWNRRQEILKSIAEKSMDNAFPALDPYGKICVPIGEQLAFWGLARHNALQLNYYYTIPGVVSKASIERMIADLRGCRYAIFGPYSLSGSAPEPYLNHDRLGQYLGFPLRWFAAPPFPPTPEEELYAFIKTSFAPLGQFRSGLVFCQRR